MIMRTSEDAISIKEKHAKNKRSTFMAQLKFT
jgi:hypothetical protein